MRRAIRTDACAARAVTRAGRRRPMRWHAAALDAQAVTGVDARLVCAVMAVEHGARGRVARAIEYAYVLMLCALGRHADAEWVSVGPAQVQLRHAGPGTPVVPRMVRLARAGTAAVACAQVLQRECTALDLDPAAPDAWTPAQWRQVGCAYGGDLAAGYGIAIHGLRAAMPPHPPRIATAAEPLPA